jgi:Lon protease-like protein
VNQTIEVIALITSREPEADHARRLVEMAEFVDRLPLFPLGIVLLPSEVVPLHIFEERYKLMIAECLENDGEFGIVWLSDGGLREVGCTARVSEVLQELEDGRMNILVAGDRPFRLARRIEDLPYPAGDVDLLDSEDDAEPELLHEARERYADLVERVTDERPGEEDLSELDAYGMAATIEFEAKAKQELLELRSERERLVRVSELFGVTVQRIEESERVGELARTNGKVQFPT